jgi:hypothetical protein
VFLAGSKGEERMSVKLRVKLGDVELEFEGEGEFIKTELKDILATISDLRPVKGVGGTQSDTSTSGGLTSSDRTQEGNGPDLEMTVANIAVKLGVDKLSDLVLAAGVYLTFVEKKSRFPRKELLIAMQTASNDYTETHSKNMTQLLASLVKADTFNELSKGVYALTSKKKQEVMRTLGLT